MLTLDLRSLDELGCAAIGHVNDGDVGRRIANGVGEEVSAEDHIVDEQVVPDPVMMLLRNPRNPVNRC